MKRHSLQFFCLTGLLLSSIGAAQAQLIDINFTNSLQYSGAAAVGSAGDVWNNLNFNSTGYNFTSGVLVDSTGATTTVGSSPGVEITTAGFGGTGGGYNSPDNFAYNLFSTSIQAYGSAISISYTFSGLAANQTYQLELYTTNYDQGGGFGLQRGVTFSTNDGSAEASDKVATNAFVAGDNYASLTGTTDNNGNLVITGVSTPTSPGFGGEIDLTGIQLQATSAPEPLPWAMMLMGLGTLVGMQRFLRRT